MIRQSIIAAAFGVLALAGALPASAASITVNVAKLDAKATHTKIVEAAGAACRAEIAPASPLDEHYTMPACVTETTAAAEQELAARKGALAKL